MDWNLRNSNTFARSFSNPKKMKKSIALFAIVGLMATASCGNKEVQETEAMVEESTEVVVEETMEIIEEITDSTAVLVGEVVEVIEEVK